MQICPNLYRNENGTIYSFNKSFSTQCYDEKISSNEDKFQMAD